MMLRVTIVICWIMAAIDGLTISLAWVVHRPFVERELIGIHWIIAYVAAVGLGEMSKWRKL